MARDAALGKGTDLGTFKDWSLQTTGADVKFATEVGGQKYPALVLDKPQWRDPAPRDLIAERSAAFKGLGALDALKAFVDDVLAKEKAYFAAEGVEVKSSNERYGIQNVRRKAFFGEIRAQIK